MCLQGWLSAVAKQISLQEDRGGVGKAGKTTGSRKFWGVQGKTKTLAILFSPLWLNSKEALFCSQ